MHIYLRLYCEPRVFHLAIHASSDTGKEFVLRTFPRTILRQLEACADATWLNHFASRPPRARLAPPWEKSPRTSSSDSEYIETPYAEPPWDPELDHSPHLSRQR